MNKMVQIGDSIKLSRLLKFKSIRHNDKNDEVIKKIFLNNSICNVVGKESDNLILACYDTNIDTFDYFYVIELIDGAFKIRKHCENTQKGAIYYKEDFFGYIGENTDYVYLVHYSIWEEPEWAKKDAMRKVKKDEYYKHAISIYEYDYKYL